MKKLTLLACLCAAVSFPAFPEARPLDTLFPALNAQIKECLAVRGIYFNVENDAAARIQPNPNANIPPLATNEARFKYIIETLILIPGAGTINLTDIYNVIKDLQTLEGRVYYSVTRKKHTVLFQEATRIINEKNHRPFPDNVPVAVIPDAEVRYIRLKDANFGNCYYRADVQKAGKGIHFKLTNFKNISFLFISIFKENDLLLDYYIEPVAEGIAIYGIIGARTSDFIENYVDVPSAIIKRIDVINSWIIDGLREYHGR